MTSDIQHLLSIIGGGTVAYIIGLGVLHVAGLLADASPARQEAKRLARQLAEHAAREHALRVVEFYKDNQLVLRDRGEIQRAVEAYDPYQSPRMKEMMVGVICEALWIVYCQR